jgi:hypothetical protein
VELAAAARAASPAVELAAAARAASPAVEPGAAARAASPGGGAGGGGTGGVGGCVQPSDCPGVDDECQARTCVNNTCGVDFTAAGTPIASQSPGDCLLAVCDGAGSVTTEADTNDPQDDSNPCTDDVCNAGGTTDHTPSALGATCGVGLFCDGNGVCVGCIDATDCPTPSNECEVAECNAGVCGTGFAALGTPLASQSVGDCLLAVCDGAGGTTDVDDDLDEPDDQNDCTTDGCASGAPTHVPVTAGTGCGASLVCDAAGNCVGCNVPADCGSDTACATQTCVNNTCGVAFQPASHVVGLGTVGDCRDDVCDGAGNVVTAGGVNLGDVPASDGLDCTTELCDPGTTNPASGFTTAGTPCDDNGGAVCSGAGACVACVASSDCSGTPSTPFCSAGNQCVACLAPSDCPGSDTECQTRTCTAGACGFSFTASGTPLASQTPGDCQEVQCNGVGGTVSVANDLDEPADDGNQCTDDTCSSGAPVHPALPADTACNQNGGDLCDGNGVCVECNDALDCPGSDTECQTRTCSSGTCGFSFTASGTPLASQTPGDCVEEQCDGAGGVVDAPLAGDLPVDGNECTEDLCTAGVPSNPGVASGTACTQNGGVACNGLGDCVSAPVITLVTPADGTLDASADTTISITFDQAMDGATLTTQTVAGACTGAIQVSLDDFATCIALDAAVAALSAGDTVATVTPAPGLLVNEGYKVRVTTSALNAAGLALGATQTQPNGFLTESPDLCAGSVVISQVYGGGGLRGRHVHAATSSSCTTEARRPCRSQECRCSTRARAPRGRRSTSAGLDPSWAASSWCSSHGRLSRRWPCPGSRLERRHQHVRLQRRRSP